MIATIITVGMAMIWLGFESDWLRAPWLAQTETFVTVARAMLALPTPKVTTHTVETQYSVMVTPTPIIPKLLDTVHFKPSTFQPLDMPKTTGDVNIMCKRS